MQFRLLCGKKSQSGFTLVELVLVTAFIGILAVIAIAQFAQYKNYALCARVESDAGNAVVAMEAYFASRLTYDTLEDAGFTESKNVAVAITGTDPLTIAATDETSSCTKGNTFTLSQGAGVWS